MALLAWDSSKRSAIRARKRLIGTRSSGRSPVGIGALGNGADLAPPAEAFSASPLVIRPSRPVPATCPASTFFSARIFAADGDAEPPADFAGAAAGAGAAALAPEAALGAAGVAAVGSLATALSDLPAEIGENLQRQKEQGKEQDIQSATISGIGQAALADHGLKRFEAPASLSIP